MWLGAATIAGLPIVASASSAANAFDGRWAASIVCEDVRYKRSLVKGCT